MVSPWFSSSTRFESERLVFAGRMSCCSTNIVKSLKKHYATVCSSELYNTKPKAHLQSSLAKRTHVVTDFQQLAKSVRDSPRAAECCQAHHNVWDTFARYDCIHRRRTERPDPRPHQATTWRASWPCSTASVLTRIPNHGAHRRRLRHLTSHRHSACQSNVDSEHYWSAPHETPDLHRIHWCNCTREMINANDNGSDDDDDDIHISIPLKIITSKAAIKASIYSTTFVSALYIATPWLPKKNLWGCYGLVLCLWSLRHWMFYRAAC